MKDDYCENCPMHYLECDYWGEWDEGCSAGLDGWFDGKYSLICKMPKVVKKVYLKCREWKDELYWKIHIKKYEEELTESDCYGCKYEYVVENEKCESCSRNFSDFYERKEEN